MNPRHTIAVLVAALALSATACSVSVDPDEVGLECNAGGFSSTEFDQCVQSGTREYRGPGDQVVLQPFHELIGKKYEAHTAAGWVEMLGQYFGGRLRRALDDASTEFDAMDLYTDDETKAAWEDRVGELSTQYVAEMAGDEYLRARGDGPAAAQDHHEGPVDGEAERGDRRGGRLHHGRRGGGSSLGALLVRAQDRLVQQRVDLERAALT
jgi:hypothetical protein